ncbi:GDSL-type esterase/lipase family protein [Silvibacterium dinghuense]|uniref:GDSL-type esterase/lipase family protein n=1 Tax=Silvibacterium dinghuense TaxID=1560006 RepID=UPI0013E94A04|nr:GDSL-type esterase/lipase family protein [Silvibacterium dinghuense]
MSRFFFTPTAALSLAAAIFGGAAVHAAPVALSTVASSAVPSAVTSTPHKKKASTTASSHTAGSKAARKKGARLGAGKSSGAHAKTRASKKSSAPAYQSYVPVPQARPVPQPQETGDGNTTAVPAPDMAAEQEQRSYAQASPEAATALSVEDRLAHGGSALHFAGSLQNFFTALRAQGGPQGSQTVRVLQFGDSHTAADMFTGELRSQMQSRFGDASVGFTYAGHPFAGYRILGSGRGQSAGWTTLGTHFTQLGDALLGMGGVAIEAQGAGETASLSVNCRTLDVQFLRREGGGSFTVTDNGQAVQTVPTALVTSAATQTQNAQVQSAPAQAPQPPDAQTQESSTAPAASPDQAGSVTLSCQPGRNDFSFTTIGDGPVRLLGTVSLQPGITWEAIGINGAEAPLILRWNRSLFDTYLASRPPQLIVLAYGTNEAAGSWTREDYQASFATLIDHLHTVSPDASILVLGPGDRAIARSSYVIGRRGRRIQRRAYVPYTGTERIIDAQREVCRTHHCAFWDWSARQGGFGSMQRWVAAGYAQPDHTHLTGTGYRVLADALFADVMSSYDGFVKRGTIQDY